MTSRLVLIVKIVMGITGQNSLTERALSKLEQEIFAISTSDAETYLILKANMLSVLLTSLLA